jgi:hypothetical protein
LSEKFPGARNRTKVIGRNWTAFIIASEHRFYLANPDDAAVPSDALLDKEAIAAGLHCSDKPGDAYYREKHQQPHQRKGEIKHPFQKHVHIRHRMIANNFEKLMCMQ